MHKWLVEEGLPSLPAEYHDLVNTVASEVLATYPCKAIEGLSNLSGYVYAMLYRATPPTWLTDASIGALCERLVQDYPDCRFAGFQNAATTRRRTRGNDEKKTHVSEETRRRVFQYVAEEGVDTIILPLNFLNAHWCCVIVKVKAKRIFYYDPLNQTPYMSAAKAIANNFKLGGLHEYDVIPQNNPIQFDAFSCGVYVSWMFVRQAVAGPLLDVSSISLSRRRFELFYYLMSGRLLPLQDSLSGIGDTEDKGQAS